METEIAQQNEPTLLEKASQKYGEYSSLRATVQVIPCVGGALDTLFSGKGAQFQQQRIEYFLSILDQRLTSLEIATDLEADENFYDFIVTTFDGVIRTKSEEKIKRFANIVANQATKRNQWEEADTAIRLLTELSEIHVSLLLLAIAAPPCTSPFDGLKVVTLSQDPHGEASLQQPISLLDVFPDYSPGALRMICAELVSRGLIHDEGVGRMDTKSFEYFIATELASWLIEWIKET